MQGVIPAALLASFVAVATGSAQEAKDVAGNAALPASRFELKAQGDGFIRLDRQTGDVSYCSVAGDALDCRLAGNEPEAWQQQLSGLQDRIKVLEDRSGAMAPTGGVTSTKRQDRVGAAVPAQPVQPPEADPGSEGLANDDAGRQLDQAAAVAQRAMRKFFEVVKQMKQDLENTRTAQ